MTNPALPPMMTPDRFFRFKEVQDLLGVSRSTLWRWIAEKGLKVIRVGGVARIRESDLEKFMTRHEMITKPKGS